MILCQSFCLLPLYVSSYVEGCMCKNILFWQSNCIPWWKLLHRCFSAMLRHLKSSQMFLLVYFILFTSFKVLGWGNQKYLLLVQCLAVLWSDRLSAPSVHTFTGYVFTSFLKCALIVYEPSCNCSHFFHRFYSIPL